MPNTNPRSINAASNPDYIPGEAEASSPAKIRAEAVDSAVVASTNAGDFEAREGLGSILR